MADSVAHQIGRSDLREAIARAVALGADEESMQELVDRAHDGKADY